MEIQTTNSIPDEIKNVVELLYSRSKEVSRAEAEHLKEQNPELSPMLDRVMQLMDSDELPPDAGAFCEAIAMPAIIDDMGQDDAFVDDEDLIQESDDSDDVDSPLPGELFFDAAFSSETSGSEECVHTDGESNDSAGDEERAESS